MVVRKLRGQIIHALNFMGVDCHICYIITQITYPTLCRYSMYVTIASFGKMHAYSSINKNHNFCSTNNQFGQEFLFLQLICILFLSVLQNKPDYSSIMQIKLILVMNKSFSGVSMCIFTQITHFEPYIDFFGVWWLILEKISKISSNSRKDKIVYWLFGNSWRQFKT